MTQRSMPEGMMNAERAGAEAMQKSDRFAAGVLWANAAFSLASGMLVLAGASSVTQWLGLAAEPATTLLRLIGAGVVLFGLFVAWAAGRRPVSADVLLGIAVADFAWVALSGLLLVSGWVPFSSGGKWIIALVADVVLLLGVLEFFGWRRLRNLR